MTVSPMEAERGPQPINLERRGALSLATLKSFAAHDLLALDAISALTAWYPSLARDPGIYAAILQSGQAPVAPTSIDAPVLATAVGSPAALAKLVWLHECFSKPTVALIDVAIDTVGLALTTYGTHRIAGSGYRLQVTDPAESAACLIGATYPLSRLPDWTGLYLALTGDALGSADALALGLVTHAIPAAEFPAIASALTEAEPVDPLLDARQRSTPPGPITAERARIRRYFDAPSLLDLVGRLSSPLGEDRDWAASVLARLRARTPFGVWVAFAAIRSTVRLDARAALEQDYRVAARVAATARDSELRVSSRIEDVPSEAIDRLFASSASGDLHLPSRAEMQAARV
ncbi:MAG: enoyl-CoA hydratase/isomerase family protein [Proteobacteria bacterium]|nr:enoyl-CoA hydratase/isomerase family protein [Pseudomonadota bacterium]